MKICYLFLLHPLYVRYIFLVFSRWIKFTFSVSPSVRPSVAGLAITGFSQISVTECHNLGFSKCPSHIWQYQDFPNVRYTFGNTRILQIFVTHLAIPGFSKCPLHIWQHQDFPNDHQIWRPQDFQNIRHKFGNNRIFQRSVTHLAIPGFSQMSITQSHNQRFSKFPSHDFNI